MRARATSSLTYRLPLLFTQSGKAIKDKRRLRGLLRQAQGRVLLRPRLIRLDGGALHRGALGVHPLVSGGTAQGVRRGRARRVRHDTGPQKEARVRRLDCPRNRPHPQINPDLLPCYTNIWSDYLQIHFAIARLVQGSTGAACGLSLPVPAACRPPPPPLSAPGQRSA